MTAVSSSGESRCIKFTQLSFWNIGEKSWKRVVGNVGLHDAKTRAIRGYGSCVVESIERITHVNDLWMTSTEVVLREQVVMGGVCGLNMLNSFSIIGHDALSIERVAMLSTTTTSNRELSAMVLVRWLHTTSSYIKDLIVWGIGLRMNVQDQDRLRVKYLY